MKQNNFYNISSDEEFVRKVVHIRFSIKDFTNSDNEDVNNYYDYLLLKNFALKLQCRSSKLKSEVLKDLVKYLSICEGMYNFDQISKKYKIFVNVYTLDLNDFKIFYSFKIRGRVWMITL